MRSFVRLSSCLLVSVLFGAWACSLIRGTEGNKGRILFSHAKHVAQADCADCHGGVAKSSGPTGGQFIPAGHPGCANCHEDEVKNKCEMCHQGAREGIRFRRAERGLRFSHAAHLTKTKECTSCHPKEKEEGALVPGHHTCNEAACHASTFKRLACGQCHKDLQRYGAKPTAFLTHGPDFSRAHGPSAKQAVAVCAQCHDQTFCADCHARTAMDRPSILFPEKVDRGFIHRGDYLTRHMIEAQADPASCMKCHGQRHCRACHALNGLAPTVSEGLPGGQTRAHHPAGWTAAGSPEHHGRRARQDIRRCASCHDRGTQSNCLGCHRVGGAGGSPHPPGWSWRDKTAQCRNSTMCAACHPGGQGCR